MVKKKKTCSKKKMKNGRNKTRESDTYPRHTKENRHTGNRSP